MKRLAYQKLLSLMLLVLAGCAAPVTQNVKFNYFATESKQGALAEGGLGLLPVVADASQEGLRGSLHNELNKHLSNKLPEGKFIGNLEAVDLINNAGLTENYSKLIEDYNRSATLNKNSLITIGRAVGVEHLLYVKLLEQSQTQELVPQGISMNIFGQVWSCTTGDVVWEGTGEISIQSEDELPHKQTVDKLADMTTHSILKNLPGLESTPPKISKEK